MSKKEVFVTYSWDDPKHISKVESLTEHLREKGFEAEMDVLLSQKETATDFSKMMHQAMTDYSKVIIVLSPGYKQKAEDFKGGVGKEYSLIIKDINDNPSKYILVCFDGIKDEIYPLELKNRETVNLSNPDEYASLYHKLMDTPVREFSPVAASKPSLTTRKIEPIISETPRNLEFAGLWDKTVKSSKFGGKYVHLTKTFEVHIKNKGTATDDFSVEVDMPNINTFDSPNFRIDSGRKIFTFAPSKKIFTNQIFVTDPIKIKVFEKDVRSLENEYIIIRTFTDTNVKEERLPVKALIYKEVGGERVALSTDDFTSR
jgi:hypothetical protein